MAIPFVMPGEDPDDALDQLIIELSEIIIQIQVLLRERARRQVAERRNRVCCAANSSRRSRYASHAEARSRIPQEVAATELSSNVCDNRVEILPNLREDNEDSIIGGRHRRTRATSESSCSKEAIDIPSSSHNWSQVGVRLRRIADDFQSTANKVEESPPGKEPCSQDGSILSKLVPAPFKGSLWTAVICVVGWHLLRTR